MSENSPETTTKQPLEIIFITTPLFHGAKRHFTYDNDYQFNDASLDGSFTLGEGIYLTDNIGNANNYSKVRQSREIAKPITYSVDAISCKFLDFRSENDNLPVDQNMIRHWADYFREDLEKQKREKPDLGPEREEMGQSDSPIRRVKINRELLVRQDLEKYLKYLEELVASPKRVDLREMLGTAPIRETNTDFSGNETAPTWSRLFRRFVTEELDVDGIIFNEGAEGDLEGLHSSFVVYNLKSISFSKTPINQ